MKVFVTGVAGQLGHDVMNELCRCGVECVGSDLKETYSGIDDGSAVTRAPYRSLDITDRAAVESLFMAEHFDAVIHCAAWTAVDKAEEDELRETVYRVNVTGTKNLARAASKIGAKFLYISTDYVFSGEGSEPWDPDCKAFRPNCFYGQTKLLGEEAVTSLIDRFFIVRIAWVFGLNGSNFVKTMLKVGRTHDSVRVVNDQIGTPTYTKDLAVLLVSMIQSEEYGYYHATNEGGFLSWYDFTKEIYRQAGLATVVNAVTTEEYGLSKAKRPLNSRLDKSKLSAHGFTLLPDWRDALSRYLRESGEAE